MTQVLLFTDVIPFEDLSKMSDRERYSLAKANEHLSTASAFIYDLTDFQKRFNSRAIDANKTSIFFVEVERFEVEVLECNSETFEDNYCTYIEDEQDDAFFNKRYTLVAPLCVKEEIEDLTEECINIV